MTEFTPVNSLEIILRRVITDKHTPLWDFYTPLGASDLWVIVQNEPELLDQGATRAGRNPNLLILEGNGRSYLGIYTSHARVQATMQQLKIPPAQFTCISLLGYDLFNWVHNLDHDLCINLANAHCQYGLDPDMIEILLTRPRPTPTSDAPAHAVSAPEIDPSRRLGPVRDFLRQQPHARAAWIFESQSPVPLPAHTTAYDFLLLMDDPEDDHLLPQLETMLKALTPITMEWTTGMMNGDDNSLRNLAAQQPPFYQRADFLPDA